jgi:hypothetical protein
MVPLTLTGNFNNTLSEYLYLQLLHDFKQKSQNKIHNRLMEFLAHGGPQKKN